MNFTTCGCGGFVAVYRHLMLNFEIGELSGQEKSYCRQRKSDLLKEGFVRTLM
jgi:hypothetical protein